ncbi:uncharacterized protein LOC122091394 isoform X2 [Macadamia integrifolia]|uniref:uncharacterized protein LOC122091394 isoform X2 n=1 Tax=Macadamia integrifolia TaxID=60698 RepID=UPI001C4F6129|nr:uncharacterized protein LOC122091394 isoform X2 [Macadamia integrifolia]
MGKRTESDGMKKDQLESSAASSKRAKLSTEMATKATKTPASSKKKSNNSNSVVRRSQRIQKVISCTQGKDIEPMTENIDLSFSDGEGHQDEDMHYPMEEKKMQVEDSGIQNLGGKIEISCTQTKDIEPVTENIDLSGSDEEDHQDEERHHPMEEKKMQEEDSGIRNLEGKIDYLTLLLEAQEKNHEAKSMGVDTGFQSPNLCCADIKARAKKDEYKIMYIDSQKKIERLQEENHQLAMKLENALGKLQAYEKGHTVFSETIEKLKDAMLISTITKTTEMMLGLSPGANNGDGATPIVTEARSPVAKTRKIAKSGGRK